MAKSNKTEDRSNRAEDIGYRPRVVVKFHEYGELPYEDGVEDYILERQLGPWNRLGEKFPGITLKRLFRSLEADEIRKLVATGVQRDQTYSPPDLLTYFVIECPGDCDPDDLAAALSEWKFVESAYVDPMGEEPSVNPGDDPRSGSQIYLDPAPDGIDAEFAWSTGPGSGADGTGLHVIDMERGWTLNHEDLTATGASLLHGTIRDGSRAHGTSVLGEVSGVDNAIGVVGIAPDAAADVVSYWGSTRPDALLAAINTLSFGDVILIEAQLSTSSFSNVPIEILDGEYEMIRLATALGVVVVEAAGNGSNDLDTVTNPAGDNIFDRTNSDFRDSGAIMVGAATSSVPHEPMWFTNYGNRIDCYAWGEDVETASSDSTGSTDLYTSTFNGTSSASPIITGATLIVQGIADATLGYRFSPRQVREILSDDATGTLSDDPTTDQIGVMPDLQAIITDDVINQSPDVYVRDNVGDVGDPHTGSISASPDVILRSSPAANPQVLYGEGSGTENSSTLGYEAEAGQDNYIYVRTRNRGGSAATDLTATVYWSPVSTLVTPALWTEVGSVTIPTVPSGDQLTVSDAIVWPAAELPSTGHYCLVAIIGTAEDPAPDPIDFTDFDKFRRFIRENNNVTWRNFNVVNNTPDPDADPAGFVGLPFVMPGPMDRARMMNLEIVGRLPAGARAFLEVPEHLADRFDQFADIRLADHDDDIELVGDDWVRLPVNPSGVRRFPPIRLQPDAVADLRLLVHVPEGEREREFEVAARQLHEGEEVGRVTWRLVSPARLEERQKELEETTADEHTPDGGLRIRDIHPDAKGVPEAAHLDDEYVVLENDSDETVDLSGYVLSYDDDQTYEVPDGTELEMGETLTIRTGDGEDIDTELYAGFNMPVLNNEGDTVTLYDDEGNVVAVRAYGPTR